MGVEKSRDAHVPNGGEDARGYSRKRCQSQRQATEMGQPDVCRLMELRIIESSD